MPKHKNSQKRIIIIDNGGDTDQRSPKEQGLTYFITTKTFNNYPYFENKTLCELFIEELCLCKFIKNFELYAFNILVDHIHLLLKSNKDSSISKDMQFLKRHFTRSTNFVLGYNSFSNNTHNEGDIRECRLHENNSYINPNRLTHSPYKNLQTIIDKHDKVLHELRRKFIRQSQRRNLPKFYWQKSFHDHYIRNRQDFLHHYSYIIYNHLKHSEVVNYDPNYKYTSLNYPDLITYDF